MLMEAGGEVAIDNLYFESKVVREKQTQHRLNYRTQYEVLVQLVMTLLKCFVCV